MRKQTLQDIKTVLAEEAIYHFMCSCGNGDVKKNEGCGSTTITVTLAIITKAEAK